MNWDIRTYDSLDSTNTQARRLAQAGVEEGLVVVAREQSAGKGRRGRSWDSPAGENLYVSLMLRPEISPDKAPMLTLVMAYSTAIVLRERGFEAQIKWPNDLVLAGKKVCGILTEMHLQEAQMEDIIIGVGINIRQKEFPIELKDRATSLFLESGKQINMDELLGEILNVFSGQYERFLEKQDLAFLQEDYNAMLINLGREVLVLEPGCEYCGVAHGINSNGELVVEREDGYEVAVFAGEVSVRGIYGYV